MYDGQATANQSISWAHHVKLGIQLLFLYGDLAPGPRGMEDIFLVERIEFGCQARDRFW